MMRLIQAEWRVLVRRSSARGLLLLSATLPALITGVLAMVSESAMEFNGQPISEVLSFSGPHAATLSLRVRHALFLPMFILFVTGTSFASECSGHMLRERLVRPVSRSALMFSKGAALWLLCVISLLLNAAISLSLGTIMMGAEGPWLSMWSGHLLSVFTDVGLISLGLFLSTIFRSGAMVVVSGVLFYLFDQALNAGLFLVGVAGVAGTDVFQQLLPSTGWNMWTIMLGDAGWYSAINLGAWSTVFLLISRHRMARMDVP